MHQIQLRLVLFFVSKAKEEKEKKRVAKVRTGEKRERKKGTKGKAREEREARHPNSHLWLRHWCSLSSQAKLHTCVSAKRILLTVAKVQLTHLGLLLCGCSTTGTYGAIWLKLSGKKECTE